MLLGMFHHRLQTFLELAQRRSLVHHVHVVEAIVRNITFGHKLESGVHLVLRTGDSVRAVIPKGMIFVPPPN